MARKKKTGAKARPTKTAKKRDTRSAAARVEIDEDVGPRDDPVLLALIVFTGLFLVAATIINMLHLGSSYQIGPFS